MNAFSRTRACSGWKPCRAGRSCVAPGGVSKGESAGRAGLAPHCCLPAAGRALQPSSPRLAGSQGRPSPPVDPWPSRSEERGMQGEQVMGRCLAEPWRDLPLKVSRCPGHLRGTRPCSPAWVLGSLVFVLGSTSCRQNNVLKHKQFEEGLYSECLCSHHHPDLERDTRLPLNFV